MEILIRCAQHHAPTEAFLCASFPIGRIHCSEVMDMAYEIHYGPEKKRRGGWAGVAAILGTGSNSCLFDGLSIVRNVRSGGFILGDEGGGASLGKLFLSDFLKGLVPEPIASEFASSFEADYLSIVNRVYHSPAPAAYLGSFAPWILSHADSHPYMRALIDRNLNSFIQRVLLQYDCERVGFVGGFASAFASSLKRLCAEAGIEVSSIIASPLENLISYHCQ